MKNIVNNKNMKSVINLNREPGRAWCSINLMAKSLFISALILAGVQAPLRAQETQYTKPSWWFGLAGGANLNFYNGSTYKLNSEFTQPATFHKGFGVGLYAAPLVEYSPSQFTFGLYVPGGI
jgi:hypothetical protein